MSRKRNVKKAVKAAKKYPKLVALLIIIVLIIIAVVAVMYFLKLGPFSPTDVIPPDNGIIDDGDGDSNVPVGSEAEIASSKLSIHFLELGNKSAGDSVLIKCGNTEVLIDAGSEKNSSKTLKTYIDKYCTDGKLEYVISTHADFDHISAFIGNKSGSTYSGIFYQYKIGTIIKFDNSDKSLLTESGNKSTYGQYIDAIDYAKVTWKTNVYTASQCYDMKDGAQRQYYLDENQTVSINILYNYYYYNKSSDENNYSVVTLLTQELENGKKNYLFTGDLEEDGEKRMVNYYKNVPAEYRTDYNVLPEVDVYKAGHHGSKTSSTLELLKVIRPKYVAVCCCCGSPEYTLNNQNTFPTQQMIDNVAPFTENIFVTSLATEVPEVVDGKISSKKWNFTSMNGNIVFYYDESLKLYCSNNTTVLKDTEWFKNNRTWPTG
ncbi:MAG: MBL fold metallo-hydrolase [Clostridia bacterium]|nr:MBL fold metallo-hydrolase [Clostridia bacterium]